MQTLKLQLKMIITVILCGILFVSNFTVIKAENKLTNIYLMGDSTVSSRDNDYINGWGNHLYRYFDKNQKIEKLETISQYEDAVRYTSSKVKIENWAKSGASVRSYYNDPKLFKNVYNRLRKGDYVFIQFGHNEINKDCQGSDVKTYVRYLTTYINKIQSKKAIPILITSPPLNNKSKGKYYIYVPAYRKAMVNVGKKKKVQVIDLGSKCVEYLNQRNSTEVSSMYIPDNMHFTPKGARILARIIATELKDSDKSKKLSGNIWLPTYNLNKYLVKVEKLNKRKYTKKSWKIVQKHYIYGKKIIYDENTTRKEINTTQSKLKKAIKNLKKKKTKAKKK